MFLLFSVMKDTHRFTIKVIINKRDVAAQN